MTLRRVPPAPDPFRVELGQRPSRILQAAVGDPTQIHLLLTVVNGLPNADEGVPAQWRAVARAFAGQPGRAVEFLLACSQVAQARHRRPIVPPQRSWAPRGPAPAGPTL